MSKLITVVIILLSLLPASAAPSWREVAKRLAAAYYALGRYDQVLRVLRTYELWPWEGERTAALLYSGALMAKALRAFEREQYARARRFLEEAMVYPENLHMGQPAYPRFAKIRYFLARCLEALGEEGPAREVLKKAADEQYYGWDRGHCEALYYKGLAALGLGRRAEARRLFQRLKGQPPALRRRWFRSELLHFLQALGHRGLAEMERRREHLRSARDLLAQALQVRGDYPEAQAMLNEVEGLLAEAK